MRLQICSFSGQIIRLTIYKTISFVRQCRLELLQMSATNSFQSFFAALSSLRSPLHSVDGSRRVIICIIVVLVLLMYMWPSWLKLSHQHVELSTLDLCVDAKLQSMQNMAASYDAIIPHHTSQGHYAQLPFTGNGYVGMTVSERSKLYIRSGRALTLPVKFYPTLTISIEGLPQKEAVVLDLMHGVVNKIQCFEMDKSCISVSSKSYAHRSRPSIIVQEYRVHNPTDTPVTLDLEQIGPSDWAGATTQTKSMNSKSTLELQYKLTVGMVPGEVDGTQVAVAVGTAALPDTVSVKGGSTWKYHTISAVQYSMPQASNVDINQLMKSVSDQAEIELSYALNIDAKMLRQEHSIVWRKLWSSGFSISKSKAPGALNGDKINSTIYYVLCHTAAPLHDNSRTPQQRTELEKLLYFPDRCYGEHHTLQNPRLWNDIVDVDSMQSIVKFWLITLEKHGCAQMLRAGADGVLQAMVLSFGGLKFGDSHLEFHTHPKDLHRDYFFRRINYGNNTHLNISVIVGEDNKAVLYVSLDKNDKQYYACDAGCLDPPVRLGNKWTQFPVKLTDPLTSILYITADTMHMEELKHAIHVREINEAPAHEHHVIALHRHGHHYGGLPVIFWVSIAILIIIFHLFLFKLIFNEYCNTDAKYYSRAKYNL